MSDSAEKQPVLDRVKEHSIEQAVAHLMQEPESDSVTPEGEPEATEVEEVQETEALETEESEAEYAEEEPEESEEETEEVEYVEEVEEPSVTDYYQVKVNGEELEVTLDELQSGYQRQKDYTKKTQEVAEQRKEFESKQAELQQLQENFMNQAVLANEVLNRDLKKFETVDWETLKVTDPTEYVAKQVEMQDIKQRQGELQQQAQQVYEHNLKVQEAERLKHVEAERKKTLEVFPEWKDQKKAEAGQLAIVEFARAQGYHDQELANVVNARDLMILDKARKYDELIAQKGSISQKKTKPSVRKVIKPKGTAPKSTGKARAVKAKKDQLRKSGSLRDAASLMHEMKTSNKIRK